MTDLKRPVPKEARRCVVLSTLGSLGDLYPVLSVAKALTRQGVEVRLALTPEDCDVARDWGLTATPVGPSQAEMCAALGMTRDEVAASVLRDPRPLLKRALLPLLPEMTQAVLDLSEGAACVAGTPFAMGAALAAERRGLPFVPMLLQPLMAMAPSDPPTGGVYALAIRRPKPRLALLWNRFALSLIRRTLRMTLLPGQNRLRRSLGLPATSKTPLLDYDGHIPFLLGLWDEVFAPCPQDGPDGLILGGFPPAPAGGLPDGAQTWLDAGPPPLVVTLGSIAQGLGRDTFWQDAADMARRMDLRAVLLHGTAGAPAASDQILPLAYAAHAPLFPQAAAIVHHGGIGTTAEALRAGRPQLVLPVGGDQPDNAARLRDLDLAATLPITGFTAARGAEALRTLLSIFDDPTASKLAKTISNRNGATFAADRIATLLPQH
ncbi:MULTISPECIES: glycosyltransferase [Jannaschia]|uniref:glycosyltransferase n=1 Tax=Jannaschia TaxID=188905 RepID=UPI001C7DEADE|nr:MULTISPECIES: glycosyltransferase [unclassified Jannaschia]